MILHVCETRDNLLLLLLQTGSRCVVLGLCLLFHLAVLAVHTLEIDKEICIDFFKIEFQLLVICAFVWLNWDSLGVLLCRHTESFACVTTNAVD